MPAQVLAAGLDLNSKTASERDLTQLTIDIVRSHTHGPDRTPNEHGARRVLETRGAQM